MMDSLNFRRKQRFEHFDRAFQRLQETVQQPNLHELERNGLMERFEFTLELAWKAIR
jgi:DNA-binding HxlR family transcriptional regulator